MNIPVSDAKGQLTDIVMRAEHGEDIILTRHRRAMAQLVALGKRPSPAERRAVLHAVRAQGRQMTIAGAMPDRSQDFLYAENGPPG